MSLKENIIFIENGNYSNIKDALKQWIELYQEKLDSNLKFKLFKYEENYTVIELNTEIENELFNYLINYLTYPEKNKNNVLVKGFTIIKDKKIFPENLLNKSVQISVPKNDKDFDKVIGVVKSGETYKIDFGGNTALVNNEIIYSKPAIEYKNCASEIIEIDKKSVKEKQNNNKLKKFNFRFLIITSCFIAGNLIAGYLTYKTENFVTLVKISSFGLFIWTMLEYELLRLNSAYLKLLSLSIIFSLLGYYLSVENSNDTWFKSTKLSLCFLILYKILRSLYLAIYKREPDFGNNTNLIADRIYSFILLVGTLLTSLLL
ncbi:hypothetical protein K6119_04200 [Paracrocinitomix mangrovi]|uniref:hypothetical protein n=1 Tax=Paracrocinitomix mangrovi TaxID=2862509 RepID=UPI001C8EB730|nr:hypothetical protein [Paracrocinitomix mangrovi]UKN02715.1 hypothetical protein K6119_04200 [Paracrocinitomix mangrovi]